MFGPHVDRIHAQNAARPTLTQHIEAAIEEAKYHSDFKVQAVQVFVASPRARVMTLHPDEAVELKAFIAKTKLRVIAHSTYSASPWTGDPDAARHIRDEAKLCESAGIVGLVVHLPKAPIETVLKYIARIYTPHVRIYLETPAVTPRETYYESPEKIADLFDAIRARIDPKLEHFGLCIDTAHLWVSGVDLSADEAAEAWLSELEDYSDSIPSKDIMIHLNDSMRELGTGPDAHAGLTAGKIWGKYHAHLEKSGLAAFVDYAQRHDTMVIIERKPIESIKHDYTVLNKLLLQ